MRIEMIENKTGSPNGYDSKMYEAGEVYSVPEDLGTVFVKNKWAKPAAEAGEKNGPPPAGKIKALVDIEYKPEGGAVEYVLKKGQESVVPGKIPHEVAEYFIKQGWVAGADGKKSGFFDWARSKLKG